MGRQSRRKKEARLEGAGTSKRTALYADYARNLSAYRPEFSNQFACPLCLRLFNHDSLSQTRLRWRLVSGKLGGTQLTLTCKDCNNTHGTKYDSHLVRWREYEDHVAGLSRKQYRAKVIIGDANLNATITNKGTNGPIALEVVPGRVDPKEMRKAQTFLAASPDNRMALRLSGQARHRPSNSFHSPASSSVPLDVQTLWVWLSVASTDRKNS